MIEPTGLKRTAWRAAWVAAGAAVFVAAGCGDTSASDSSGHSAGAGGASAGSAAIAGGGMLVSAGGEASGGKAGSLGSDGGVAGAVFGMSGSSGNATSGGSAGNAGMAPFGGAGGVAGGAGFAGMLGGGGSSGGETSKVTLFSGQDLALWKSRNGGGAAPWTVADGAFTVVPNSGDIETKEAFGDIQLHVEFWIPTTPTTNAEQDRGNSGVYLQGRYEVQVLDSYQHPLDGMNDCGAIYELKNADVNAALPPENWQTYEITFRAPRWAGQTKTESAKISVIWNGQQAQKDISVPAPTKLGDPEMPGDAPLRLQDHGHSVRYRNIWLQKL